MKKILLTIITVSLFACQEKETTPSYALVSGTLENYSDGSVMLYNTAGDNNTIEVTENGTFTDTVYLENPSYYTLRIGRKAHNLYLAPTQTLDLKIDMADKNAQPTFSGTAAIASDYFTKKNTLLTAQTEDMAAFYSQEEKAFETTLNSMAAEQLEILKNSNLPDSFVALETKAINYKRLDYKLSYPQAHSYFAKKENFTPSDSFNSEFASIDMDNEVDAAALPIYRSFVFTDFNNEMNANYDPTKPLTFSSVIDMIKEYKSPSLRNEFMKNSLFFMSPSDKDFDQSYQEALSIVNSEAVKETITKKYDVLKNLVEGKPSPQFNYENHKGGETALAELKGKYVYIDVWATWCGPCIGEIPSLQAMEEEFHDSNVEFVSISIDEKAAYDTWRKMVTDKELGGEQLIADNAWQSKFVEDYGISGIPRFILLDPQGNIVSADAKRPSNPALKNQFKELGL